MLDAPRRGRPPRSLMQSPIAPAMEQVVPDIDWRAEIAESPSLTPEQKAEQQLWTVLVRCRTREVHTGDDRVLEMGDEAWVTPAVAAILTGTGQAVEVARRD